jgi:ATP-dependent DNA helicase
LERGDFDERGLKVIKTKEEEEAEEAKLGREFQFRTKGKLLLFSAFPPR